MDPLATIMEEVQTLVFTAGCVFARVGAVAFLVPGIGERAVPMRVRLAIALGITVLLAPMIHPLVAETPQTPSGLLLAVMAETACGLVIGIAFRLLIVVLQVAGTVAAFNISLAQVFGAGVAPEPEPTIATLLSLGGIVLLFVAGLHVEIVSALAGSYEILPFAEFPRPGELATWSVERFSESFARGVTLALPMVAAGFVYNMALGAISKAMPQLLVSLIGVPVLIAIGLGALWIALPEIFARWSEGAGAVFANPLGGIGP